MSLSLTLKKTAPLLVLVMSLTACHPDGDMSESILPEFFTALKSETPREVASEKLSSPDPDIRAQGIAFFAAQSYGGEDLYLKVYRQMIDYHDYSVRIQAVKSLGIHGKVEDVLAYIVPRLQDQSKAVRWQAAVALGKIHEPKAVGAIVKTLQNANEDDQVRMAAARGLGQYPSRLVFGVLVQSLDEHAYSISYEALVSLKTITGQDFSDNAEAWLKWSQNETGDLFKNKKVYTYQTFQGKNGMVNNIMGWKKARFSEPKQPTGTK